MGIELEYMGIELEYKLAVSSPALLETILFDPQVKEVRRGDYQLYHMATIYYDTPDRRLGTLRWTLRLRQENSTLVATLKTPAQGNIRGEWSCQAANIREAVPVLLETGAPEELASLLAGQSLEPVCAAQFTRRAANLAFADGTVCELAGDVGLLAGGGREEPLCELELELKEGSAEVAEAFAQELKEKFSLREEPLSKFARASALAEAKP